MPSESSGAQTLTQARAIVADLFTVRPWIYWCDFLATMVVAYSSAIWFMQWRGDGAMWQYWTIRLATYLVAGVALYRLALFMHEIVHFRRGQMTTFTVTWNLLAGVPMLLPSFLYGSHLAHHNTHHYGTVNDGEYLPLGGGRLWQIATYLSQILLLPILVLLRFLIIGPISFVHQGLRQYVLERMSSLVINFSYRRAVPDSAPRAAWAVMEFLCFLRASAIVLWMSIGWAPWYRLIELYLLAFLALGLNYVRTLVAHRYMSDGEKMSHPAQLADSVNVSGNRVTTELMFPVGLRYHALHHLFPSLPYHNLGIAHRRLMKYLPHDSVYHRATQRSFFSAAVALLTHSRKAAAHPPRPADSWYASRADHLAPTPTAIETADEIELADRSIAGR